MDQSFPTERAKLMILQICQHDAKTNSPHLLPPSPIYLQNSILPSFQSTYVLAYLTDIRQMPISTAESRIVATKQHPHDDSIRARRKGRNLLALGRNALMHPGIVPAQGWNRGQGWR